MVGEGEGEGLNRKWIVVCTAVAVILAFVAGAADFKSRSNQEVRRAAQTNSDALVRPHSPTFGNPRRQVHLEHGAGQRVICTRMFTGAEPGFDHSQQWSWLSTGARRPFAAVTADGLSGYTTAPSR